MGDIYRLPPEMPRFTLPPPTRAVNLTDTSTSEPGFQGYLNRCTDLANLYTDLPAHEKQLFANTLATLLYRSKHFLAPKALNLVLCRTTDEKKWFMALVYVRDSEVLIVVRGNETQDRKEAVDAFQMRISQILGKGVGWSTRYLIN